MWFRFLGTSAGAPTRTRNVTGLAVGGATANVSSKQWLLVDCGEGTQHRVMQAGLSLCQLQAVCITHVHGDHCLGLPGLLASASMMGREEPLTIVAPAVLQEWLLNTLEVSHSHVQYPIVFHAHEPVPKRIQTQGAKQLQGQRLDLAGFNTTLVPLSHRVPCHGFVFDTPRPPRQLDSEKLQALSVPQGPLWGQLAAGKSVVLPTGERIDAEAVLRPQRPALRCLVGGDNDQPECFKSVAADADVLIHEATYTEAVAERVGPAPQHSSAARVARFAEQVGVPNLVLTHFSPRYRDAVANPDESSLPSAQDRASKTGRHCILEIQQEATRYYNGQLFLAEDHAHFQLTPSGVLSRVEG